MMVSSFARPLANSRNRAPTVSFAFRLFIRIATLGLSALAGCDAVSVDVLPDTRADAIDDTRFRLVARIAHISDAQVVDEESPGRLAAVAALNASAWRPQERFSIHLLDGMLRAVNAYHELVAPVDFLIHTGDAADNVQLNEVRWFLDCFDGETIDPLSGIDDRPLADRGPPARDPHAPFRAAGLYRNGVHGAAATIPWYAVMGNHDRYAVGTFPITPRLGGGLMAPLPSGVRVGLFLPVVLVPDGALAYGPITPAHPGPPPRLLLPTWVMPNPDRRFLAMDEVLELHRATITGPVGHGFSVTGRSWYAVTPVPGLRLIVLDTSIASVTVPAGIYDSGAIVAEQMRFLEAQIGRAEQNGELVVVATHHPSETLSVALGTALSGLDLQALLNAHPRVIAHLAGHTHRHRIVDRGGYLEIETASIIDAPQEGRIIEIWRDGDDVELRYATISHLYTGSAFEGLAELPADPFLELRREAFALAAGSRWSPEVPEARSIVAPHGSAGLEVP